MLETNCTLWKRTLSLLVVFSFAAVVFSLASGTLRAQSFYGSIVGTVTDSSQASVPGATVTLTNPGTSERRSAQTDATMNSSTSFPAITASTLTKPVLNTSLTTISKSRCRRSSAWMEPCRLATSVRRSK
jgi:hypothetical protein